MSQNKYAGTQTEKNLLEAFAGESQARNKYTYFASQAKKEGYEQIAAIFLETAENEREHAKCYCTSIDPKHLHQNRNRNHCHTENKASIDFHFLFPPTVRVFFVCFLLDCMIACRYNKVKRRIIKTVLS